MQQQVWKLYEMLTSKGEKFIARLILPNEEKVEVATRKCST